MSISTRTFDYSLDGNGTYEAFIATSDKEDAPVILICHAWAGRTDFEDNKAKALAELGYTGVAIDLYGKGVQGQSKDENQKLMAPFMDDRTMLQERLKTITNIVSEEVGVDHAKIGAIGFCFGGLCVLDMARSGAIETGVVSFHGLLAGDESEPAETKSKVLVLHGWADPMSEPDDVKAFGEEMEARAADWQLHGYGGVMHAFTNPSANDPDFGTVYDEKADKRSWAAMRNFLDEVFQ